MEKKFKIVPNEPKISSEEINAFQDFDGLLAKQNARKLANNKKRYLTIMAVSSVLLISVIFVWKNQSSGDHITKKTQNKPLIISNKSEKNPFIENKRAKEISLLEKTTPSTDVEKTKQEKLTSKRTDTDVMKHAQVLQKEEDINIAYSYTNPSPKKTKKDLYLYFKNNLIYPKGLKGKEIYGEVLVKCMIDTSGLAQEIEIVQTLHPLLDEEAKRLVSNMPAWTPATENKKPVKATITIPVLFQEKN